MTDDLTSKLAERLGALRHEKGLTLDQLAAESGVSRAALSRLENAEVSPSADVLARLAKAHGMSLSRLLAMVEDGFSAIVRRDDQPIWRDGESGYTRRVVSPGAQGLAMEMLECKLPPETEVAYETAPVDGQEHHIYMLSGRLAVEEGGHSHALGPGDTLRYRLHGPSRFSTAPGQGAKYVLCLVAP